MLDPVREYIPRIDKQINHFIINLYKYSPGIASFLPISLFRVFVYI